MSSGTTPGPDSSGSKPGIGGLIGALSSIAFGLLACACMALMWVADKQLFPVRPDGIGSLLEAILFSPLALGFVGFSAAAVLVGVSTLVIRPSFLAVAGMILGGVPWVALHYSPAGQKYSNVKRIEAAQNAQVLQTRKELAEFLRMLNSTAPVSLVLSRPDYPNTCFAQPKQVDERKQTLWAECRISELHGAILIHPSAPSSLNLRVTLDDSLSPHPGGSTQADTDVSKAPPSRVSMIFNGNLVADKTVGALHGQSINGKIDQVFGTGTKDRSVQISNATFDWIGFQDGPDRIADANFTFDLESYEQRPAMKYRIKLKLAW